MNLISFFVYICTIMVATGMYYGVQSTNIWSDIIMSFIISIIATTPGFVIRKLFEYSKPAEEEFTRKPSLHSVKASLEGVSAVQSHDVDTTNLQTMVEMRRKFYEWMYPVCTKEYSSTSFSFVIYSGVSIFFSLLVSIILQNHRLDHIGDVVNCNFYYRGLSPFIFMEHRMDLSKTISFKDGVRSTI